MVSKSGRFVILFVCTGNTCRSPMAEYALRALLDKERPGKVKVVSAGTIGTGGYPATMHAVEAARVWHLNLRPHRSQGLSAELIAEADLIIVMASEHHRAVTDLDPDAADKTYLLKKFPDNAPVGEPVDDPIGLGLEDYNRAFLEIGEYLGQHLPTIVQMIDEKLNA
jgi:protein-tyrosine-phosphatase